MSKNPLVVGQQLARRQQIATTFRIFCTGVTFLAMAILAILIYQVTSAGAGWLDWQFLTSFPSRFPEKAGINPVAGESYCSNCDSDGCARCYLS
jgi:ABC-type phosphate transport system permease subunit